jgi:hypothetical protein
MSQTFLGEGIMDDVPNATKAERFTEFLRRLDAASPASTFGEDRQQLSDILNCRGG